MAAMATKSTIDGPAGPVVAGDHMRRDRTKIGVHSIWEYRSGVDLGFAEGRG